MEADKGKEKMANDNCELLREGYEGLQDVYIDISMLQEDDQIQHNNEVYHGNSVARRRNTQDRPSPFVLKIYEMLADVQFKSFISWSNEGTSFIINDHHQFAAQVLPQFYRHNNITSFICQLNCYGFRKISWDRFEFQHEWFQQGKGQWLKNIKRKSSKKSQEQEEGHQQQQQQGIDEMAAFRIEKEMEGIREEQLEMQEQIIEMQQQLDMLEKEIEEITKQARNNMSNKKAKMIMFLESFFGGKEKQGGEMEDGAERRKRQAEVLEKNDKNKGFESDSNLGKLLMDEMNTVNLAQEQPDNFVEPAERPNFWTEYVEKMDHKALISGVGPSVSQSQD